MLPTAATLGSGRARLPRRHSLAGCGCGGCRRLGGRRLGGLGDLLTLLARHLLELGGDHLCGAETVGRARHVRALRLLAAGRHCHDLLPAAPCLLQLRLAAHHALLRHTPLRRHVGHGAEDEGARLPRAQVSGRRRDERLGDVFELLILKPIRVLGGREAALLVRDIQPKDSGERGRGLELIGVSIGTLALLVEEASCLRVQPRRIGRLVLQRLDLTLCRVRDGVLGVERNRLGE
mmetsp:Transcript_7872/g.20567  ORF Transcript_7872/g.20567 Transcript_7872/m.20567 type:complete len:235 (-) Transcript_7872:541-1245(-)